MKNNIYIYNILILLIFLSCTPRPKKHKRVECITSKDCPKGKVCISNLCDPPPKEEANSTNIHLPKGMVFVPAGEFIAGTATGRGSFLEKPQQPFFLRGFFIDKYEVKTKDYLQCVEAKKCNNIKGLYDLKPNFPIANVSWNEAKQYCEYVNKRLPTELEWEKACRGVSGRLYPWGDGAPNCALSLMNGCKIEYSLKACRGKSPYKACDMSGSLWEWTSTSIPPWDPSKDPRKKMARYGANPSGTKDSLKVIKGGSLDDGAGAIRCASRLFVPPTLRSKNIGFRCAKDLK